MSEEIRARKIRWATGWTAAPNTLIRDETLGADTRLLFVYLASHDESFRVSFTGLCSAMKCGRDRLRRMIAELEEAGWLTREQRIDERGRFDGIDLNLHGEPHTTPDTNTATVPGQGHDRGISPATGEPPTGEPPTGNPPPYKKTNPLEDQSKEDPRPGEQEALLPGPSPASKPRRERESEPAGFAEFYDAYPRHEARRAAAKSFPAAVKRAGSTTLLVEAAKRYAAQRQGEDPKFTPLPATWLNQDRYRDERVHLRPVSGHVDGRGVLVERNW